MVFLKHFTIGWNWSLICPSLQGHPFWWHMGISQHRGKHSVVEGFIILWEVFIDYSRCQIQLWNVQVNTLHWCSTGSWRKKIKILKLPYLLHFTCIPKCTTVYRDVKHSFFKPQVLGPYAVTTWKLQTTYYYPHQSQDVPKILKSECLKHTHNSKDIAQLPFQDR